MEELGCQDSFPFLNSHADETEAIVATAQDYVLDLAPKRALLVPKSRWLNTVEKWCAQSHVFHDVRYHVFSQSRWTRRHSIQSRLVVCFSLDASCVTRDLYRGVTHSV